MAKKRRDQESELLNKLASLLPVPESVTSKLDKGSILRLTVYYLRMKKYSQKGIVYIQPPSELHCKDIFMKLVIDTL